MKDKTLVIKFSSERFDYKGEIPEDSNAGNRFYGEDVAEYLCQELIDDRLSLKKTDEDWGWLVYGDVKPDGYLMLAIYNQDISEDQSVRRGTNTWSISVEFFKKGKLLGFIPRKSQVACTDWLVAKIKKALSEDGITFLGQDKDF